MTLNLISAQLRQQAVLAPFAMEKQNYLMACAEIDRLEALVPTEQEVIIPLPVIQAVCLFLSTYTLERVKAQDLMQQLHACMSHRHTS